MAKHLVKCLYCQQIFDTNSIDFIQKGRRYAHAICAEKVEKEVSQEEKDKKALEDYIIKLFNWDYVEPRVQKQIKEYKEKLGFTYSGIKKALVFFFEVKKNPIEKANGGIGIVPYVYKDAFNYYYAIWEANQKNEVKVIENKIKYQDIEVRIPVPQRESKKRKLFTFLDEEI